MPITSKVCWWRGRIGNYLLSTSVDEFGSKPWVKQGACRLHSAHSDDTAATLPPICKDVRAYLAIVFTRTLNMCKFKEFTIVSSLPQTFSCRILFNFTFQANSLQIDARSFPIPSH